MLSDSCFDFLMAMAKGESEDEALSELIRATDHYDEPPFDYDSKMVQLLRFAAKDYYCERKKSLRNCLLRTASQVMRYLDSPPPEAGGFSYKNFDDYASTVPPEVRDLKTLIAWRKALDELPMNEEPMIVVDDYMRVSESFAKSLGYTAEWIEQHRVDKNSE